MSNRKNFVFSKKSPQKRAFSLIELSIVLIIIGLLIAGITGGASLIKSASLRSAMGEARGYNVAVNSFYVQFDSLPGDSATVVNCPGSCTGGSANSIAGDANGRIEFVNGVSPVTSAVAENANAWAALKNAGVIDTTFTTPLVPLQGNSNLVIQTPGGNIPSSKIKSAGWLFDYVGTQNVVILTAATTLTTAHASAAVASATPTVVITASDALSIDTKMDDGVPNTGKVRVPTAMGAATPGTTFCYDNDATPNNTYNTSAAANTCALTFQVDIT